MPVRRSRPLWPFGLWLAGFYGIWLSIVIGGNLWGTLADHWAIAVAMAAGSYVAGSTPMGGGTVGFPILVLLFNQPAELGRDFALAVQSIGMTSASIFILCRRQPLDWGLLRPALLGAVIGTPVGLLWLAPLVPALAIKLTFAIVWASFGLFHLLRLRPLTEPRQPPARRARADLWLGLSLGAGAGGGVAAVTGVGIDMVLYTALILLRRSDLKVAIPSSVLIMAATSLVGVTTRVAAGTLQPGVFENWLAAAPVCILGAPLGALVVDRIGRRPTLRIVALLCLGQFLWTVQQEWSALGPGGLALATGTVLGVSFLFDLAFRRSERTLAPRGAVPPGLAPPAPEIV